MSGTSTPPPTPDTLPEHWTLPAPDVVERPWRIPWLLAPPVSLLAMLTPKRLGPHLAASGWLAAWTAHLFGLVLVLGWGRDLNSGHLRDLLDPLHLLRSGLAGTALQLYQSLVSWTDVGIAAAVFVGLELGLLVISLALWAVYTVGEAPRILAGRCARLLLWSTPGWAVLPLLAPRLYNALPWDNLQRLQGSVSVLLLLIWIVWYLSVILRLGARYSGPRRGPRWEPFHPRCEECGYSLTGQRRDGRCPECGREVVRSLPDYRQPPRFADASWFGRLLIFPRTILAAIFVPDFGRACAVWKARDASEQFFHGVCILGGLAAALLVGLWNAGYRYSLMRLLLGGFSREPLGMYVVEPALVGLVIGLLLLAIGWGERSMHMLFHRGHGAKQTVIINYMTAWLLTAVVIGGASLLLADCIARAWGPWPWIEWQPLGRFHIAILIYLLGLAPGAGIGLLGMMHAWRQLRMIRYANG